MARAAETLEQFSADFGVPFLLGQRCVVGSPLGKRGRLAVTHGLNIDQPLADACAMTVQQAALHFDTTPAPFDEDAGTLLYAIHELFACTHPQTSAFYARAQLFCRAATQAVRDLPHTFEPRRVLTRHLIVQRAFVTTRADVHVKWWTGSASFFGNEAPPRLLAMPGLRRVQTERLVQPMWKLAMGSGDEELRVARVALMNALLNVSPLTRLLHVGEPVQKALGFSLLLPWTLNHKKVSPLDVLEDRTIARAAVNLLLDKGLDVSGPPLALALLQALREGCPPMVLRRATELCVHLVLVLCVLQSDTPGAVEAQPLRAILDDDVGRLKEGSRVFWALIAAALNLDGKLLQLPNSAEFSQGALAVIARLRQRLSHAQVRAVSVPLERELLRQMPKPPRQQRAAADVERAT